MSYLMNSVRYILETKQFDFNLIKFVCVCAGDFAIYLRNGATKWNAIGLNFAAACCAFIGLYAGINMASDEDVRKWLLCIIAGIFLYISLVQIVSTTCSNL